MASPDLLQIDAVRWVLTAIFAVLLWGLVDYFLYRRHGKTSKNALVVKRALSLGEQNAADFANAAAKLSAAMDGAFYRLLHGSPRTPTVNAASIVIEIADTEARVTDGRNIAASIKVTNLGPELERKCLVHLEGHGLGNLPDPFVLPFPLGSVQGAGLGYSQPIIR